MGVTPRFWPIFAGPTVTLAISFGWTSSNESLKLLTLGLMAGFALSHFISVARKSPHVLRTPIFIFSNLFILGLLVTLFFSGSPIAQQLYGVSGRNLGFLHYLFLSLILLGFSTLKFDAIWPRVLLSLVLLGTFQAIYGCIQLLGLDPVPWKNPDHWVFGTLGNPNYFSSFLGLSAVASIYFTLIQKKKYRKFMSSLATFLQTILVFVPASSQGKILFAVGVFFLILILVIPRSRILGLFWLLLGFISALFGTLGIFQFGPLSRYLYQDSVSFRGDYWRAGISMFKSNWLHGVGLDSYGDFYRMYRDSTAAHRRGAEVVSNSAHNLFIDLASTGGILVLLCYVILILVTMASVFEAFRRPKKAPAEYKLLVILWILFYLQTLISINVSSLAVWGFIFSGLIFAFGNGSDSRINHSNTKKSFRSQKLASSITPIICSGILLLLLPLGIRDAKLSESLKHNNIKEISRAVSSYPRDADQIAIFASAFGKLGKGKESLELAWVAVLENPNCSRAWELILKSQDSDLKEKNLARRTLLKLDPFYAE
jgi:O-antigen ligase